ncbi:hypothetical protein B0H67DRAFT_638150 [Lasiosphaeris hirsuta]|uniref:GH18 domain-containing protein n=1 Tax=Lasiosphaeris hirsuta TaxID=260670 RepID=A0AA40B8N5_9PEZI|nr:hypothetical protein B0H67DRAFT_638150 [Lasiosphaeris hirsuta]
MKRMSGETRVFIAIGGLSFNDPDAETATTLSDIAQGEDNQRACISSLISFLATYGFDGVDINWRYPTRGGRPDDFENFPGKGLRDSGSCKPGCPGNKVRVAMDTDPSECVAGARARCCEYKAETAGGAPELDLKIFKDALKSYLANPGCSPDTKAAFREGDMVWFFKPEFVEQREAPDSKEPRMAEPEKLKMEVTNGGQ